MVALVGLVVFAGALTLASATIWWSVAPQWQRIARLVAGYPEQFPEPAFAPPATAEHRIAVTRWSAPRPASARLREAA